MNPEHSYNLKRGRKKCKQEKNSEKGIAGSSSGMAAAPLPPPPLDRAGAAPGVGEPGERRKEGRKE